MEVEWEEEALTELKAIDHPVALRIVKKVEWECQLETRNLKLETRKNTKRKNGLVYSLQSLVS